MRNYRVTMTCLLVLAAVLLSVPAAAIAGGSSAGDNQYTDPLANQNTHTSTATHTTTTSSTPTTSPAPAATGTPTTSASSSTPTATTASTTSTAAPSSASGKSSSRLPRTGFNAALAALIGVSLISVGLVARLRIRRSTR